MAGILNHPQMPIVAGGLTLILLGGGMYLSMLEEEPTQKPAQVAQVAPAKPVTKAVPDSRVQAVAAPTPVTAPEQPVQKAVVEEKVSVEPQKVAAPEPVHEVQVQNRQVLTLDINKIREAQNAQDERIKMAMANPVPPKSAPVEPVRTAAPRVKVAAAPVARPVEQKAKSVQVSAPHPVETPSAQATVSRTPTPAASATANNSIEVVADKNDEYTEIKVTKPSPNLSAEKASSEPAAQGPVLVTTSGGKGWVRINSRRTEVVKAGDELPGLGKILSVGPYELVAEKGKLMLSKE